MNNFQLPRNKKSPIGVHPLVDDFVAKVLTTPEGKQTANALLASKPSTKQKLFSAVNQHIKMSNNFNKFKPIP